MRGVIAERLSRSWQAPHIALTMSVDMEEVSQYLRDWKKKNGESRRLKVTAILAKAVATTLLQFPRLNARLVNEEIWEYKAVHLGFAVALDDGLLVPTLRDVNKKNITAIQADLDNLFERSRHGRLRLDELQGGTFTISNLGMFGIEQFSAVLNPPEVGLLSVGVVKDTPVIIDGSVVVRPMMRITINADHRAVDGAVAAKFLNALKEVLEHPHFLETENI
jgi:pyruvate dehydrogenase E2 component (dihydrolipoamide acetyltransferase)